MSKPKGYIQREVSAKAGAKTGRHYGEISCAIRRYATGKERFTINEIEAAMGIDHGKLIGTIRGMVNSGSAELLKHGRNGRGGFPAIYRLRSGGSCDNSEQPAQPGKPCCCEEGVHQHEILGQGNEMQTQ